MIVRVENFGSNSHDSSGGIILLLYFKEGQYFGLWFR